MKPSISKKSTSQISSKTMHCEMSPISIQSHEMSTPSSSNDSPYMLTKPYNRKTMRSTEKPENEIEALIDVDKRTIIFEKPSSEIIPYNSEVDLSQPLHKITWYQDTSIEDIESAVDEVVEIMQEIKNEQILRDSMFSDTK